MSFLIVLLTVTFTFLNEHINHFITPEQTLNPDTKYVEMYILALDQESSISSASLFMFKKV